MDTLNRTRLLLLLQQFAADKTILSVARANRIEPVVMGFVPSGIIVHSRYRLDLNDTVPVHHPGVARVFEIFPDQSMKLVSLRP